ncbi:MAG: response regulator [Prochlorotrichaceae cyanobacterium]
MSNQLSKPTVLSVDDSLIMQQMIKRALDEHYTILLADNAVDALSVIYHEPISGLLLDISMPGIDGLELCRTVRNLPQFKTLPIIMITSRSSDQDKQEGKQAGATAYLTKPFNPKELRALIDQLVGDRVPSS